MNKNDIIFCLLIILIVGISSGTGYIIGLQERVLEVSKGINMTGRTGVYYIGTDVYCVKVSGRTAKEIGETELHEHCHYLVDKDENHFCTEDDWI